MKIACVQSDIIARNPEENFKHLDNLFMKIQDDTDIIILPETFTTGFPAEPELFAEDENGPTMTWLREKAKEKNCAICGSFITSFGLQSTVYGLRSISHINSNQLKINQNYGIHFEDKIMACLEEMINKHFSKERAYAIN